jgi:hypothetical protein
MALPSSTPTRISPADGTGTQTRTTCSSASPHLARPSITDKYHQLSLCAQSRHRPPPNAGAVERDWTTLAGSLTSSLFPRSAINTFVVWQVSQGLQRSSPLRLSKSHARVATSLQNIRVEMSTAPDTMHQVCIILVTSFVRPYANFDLDQGMFMEVSHCQRLPIPMTDLRVRRTEVRASYRFSLRSDDVMCQGKAFVQHLDYMLTYLLQRRIYGRSVPHLNFSLHDYDIELQT